MLKKRGERGGVREVEGKGASSRTLTPYNLPPTNILNFSNLFIYVSSFGVGMGVGRDGDSFSSSCVVVVVATAHLVVPIACCCCRCCWCWWSWVFGLGCGFPRPVLFHSHGVVRLNTKQKGVQ